MNNEYLSIIGELINNEEYQKLKEETHHHHLSNRYDHCLAVAENTYKICKKLGLDYVSATRAAILHDFFFNEEFSDKNKAEFYTKHYEMSIRNASKITTLSEKETNIISSHMYPIGGTIPNCIESVIVDLVDDAVSIRERFFYNPRRLGQAMATLAIIFINII